MKKVFKYELIYADYQKVMVPKGAKILTVKAREGRLFMWCLCDPDARTNVIWKFRLAGTGHEISDKEAACSQYVGTFFLSHFVFHLFQMMGEWQPPRE